MYVRAVRSRSHVTPDVPRLTCTVMRVACYTCGCRVTRDDDKSVFVRSSRGEKRMCNLSEEFSSERFL